MENMSLDITVLLQGISSNLDHYDLFSKHSSKQQQIEHGVMEQQQYLKKPVTIKLQELHLRSVQGF